ncbi:MAG TPA: GGDEF domain-containing protein, partial [Ramlibacter sp.]
MHPLAAGFWGAFFGTAGLMLAVSLAAFFRARRRVALLAGLSAVVSAIFVVAYLGWLPVEGGPEARLLAHVAILAAAILAPLLLSLLGLLRERVNVVRALSVFTVVAAVVIVTGWFLEATE